MVENKVIYFDSCLENPLWAKCFEPSKLEGQQSPSLTLPHLSYGEEERTEKEENPPDQTRALYCI